MSTLPQLEEKIYSLVPELKELTPGCFIKTKKLKWTFKIIFVCQSGNLLCDSGVRTTTTVERKNIIEIIGHEIHPHHWLPLLGGDYALDGEGYLVSTMQECWDYFYDNTTDKPSGGKIQYDFKKSFKDQSPEFHEWLLSQLP